MNNKVIVILGTTASGKTRLAVQLAKKFNGEIISADSRQVYKGMDIGTGKDLGEYAMGYGLRARGIKVQGSKLIAQSIPYHFIDIVSPKKQFTVAEFQKRAYKSIDDILQRGKLPIICGGTGLYIDSVVKGYNFRELKAQSSKLRAVRVKLDTLSLPQLLSHLKKIDLDTYQTIDKKNRRRVQRALEIYYETGIPKSRQQYLNPPPYEFLKIGITHPREVLAKRIKERLDERLRQGMIAEVKKLHQQGAGWKRLDDFGLEYRWVSRYIRGIISKKEMKEKLCREICHFAKRQMTWFKRDKNIQWVKNTIVAEKIVRSFISLR